MMLHKQFIKFFLFFTVTVLSFSPLVSQIQRSGTLVEPNGARYTYDWVGDSLSADPWAQIPNGFETFGTRGWISYAITHQLSRAKREGSEFFTHAERITDKRGLGGTMSAITQGCGYYLLCPGGNKDLKYSYDAGQVYYVMFINTEKDEIYIGEFLNNTLQEVNKCLVDVKWFEPDPEPYERPVVTGNPVCPPPPPQQDPPVAVIVADPEEGTQPLEVSFDGRNSYDPDGGDIVKYLWAFDSQTVEGPTPTHIFEQSGRYPVLLTVTDDEGQTDQTVQDIIVSPGGRDIPPVAKILASPISGIAPFSVELDGETSFDPDGGDIVSYEWDLGNGQQSNEAIPPRPLYSSEGEYLVQLIVIDDEGDSDTTTMVITAFPPTPDTTYPPPPPPLTIPCPELDSCWMMSYTLSMCGESIDTIAQTPIRVPCPAPTEPQIFWTNRDCQTSGPTPVQENRRLQLAGGPVFMRYRGQLSEYGMGLNGQIRYRLGEKKKSAIFIDASVFPSRRATPLDDRPYKWSTLRDSIDPNTNLPLAWYRGTRRGTANLGLGIELEPFRWLYFQAMGSIEQTFQQEDISDPRKSPENQFQGFYGPDGFDPNRSRPRLNTIMVEGRIGVRRNHLEIYIGGRLSEENRPFNLIPANELGGTHNPFWDKTLHGGIMLVY